MTENFDEKFDKEWNELDKDYMDKEAWIASRTDNPDRLGKDFWNKEYEILKVNDKLCQIYEGRKQLFEKGLLPEEEFKKYARKRSEIKARLDKMSYPEGLRRKAFEEFIARQGISADLNQEAIHYQVLAFYINTTTNQSPKEFIQKTCDVIASFLKKQPTYEDSSTLKDTIKKETDKELCMVAQRKMLARKER